MTKHLDELWQIINTMAGLIEKNEEPDSQLYGLFFQHPEVAFAILDFIQQLDEQHIEGDSPVYSALIFAFDICVAQYQSAVEANNKAVMKVLDALMNHLASLIRSNKHGLSFWLPALNAFYEVHADLTQELKDAYLDLANQGPDVDMDVAPLSHLDAIRDLIHDLSDLSVFDIAENFFAQSYAMPADFFIDLIEDLYQIDEAHDIALLTLLHPKKEVREVALDTLDALMYSITLSSISLTRLKTIKYWYPEHYHPIFDRWLKVQRKKEVVFAPEPVLAKISIKATEVDGTGSQGLFIQVHQNRKNRLCGLLLKWGVGLKDAWVTPIIPASEIASYYHQAFDDSVTLREVDVDYLQLLVSHFLAITLEHGDIPYLHFLEMQELTGLSLRPKKIDLEAVFEQLSVQIVPFTQETIKESLQRSKSWLKNKSFTESWYLENPSIDKIVNHNSSFVDGVKVCRLADAIDGVFEGEMEQNREKWQFHFLWIALWLKAKEKKNEKAWRDSFLIAYVIHQGLPLKEIPVMNEICHQTVINSVETMQERKTHLSKE